MVINVADVLSVYKKTGGMMDEASSDQAPAGGGASFSSVLKNFTGDAINSLHEGEKAANGAVTGKADIATIATALDNAEVVLTEITTIRDKAIAAYQTITGGAI